MKSVLKLLCYFLFILSVLLLSFIIISDLYLIIRILFFGMSFGNNQYPDSIWFTETFLKGIDGLKQFYLVIGSTILVFELPFFIISLFNIIMFVKVIKPKLLFI